MNSLTSEQLTVASNHWSRQNTGPSRTRWWESHLIVSHINRNYCGRAVRGTDGGDIELLRRTAGGRQFQRGVSVGCGGAYHEIRLIESGVVAAFDLFEISSVRAQQARERAEAAGVGDRVEIQVADAFADRVVPKYDLVYWKDALHHMVDAHRAVHWSWNSLHSGGVFFMNEFVGPTQMQYTERQLDFAERVRASLPERYLVNPHHPDDQVPLRRVRPDVKALLETDPTECADSGNIIPAVRSEFPEATVKLTGGIVYMLALNDILANFDETEDEALLRAMMLADDLCVEAGESLYAVAHARK
jgi:SAM-dependent methyltransferase